MKDNLTIAKECGQRLRRIRMARNMSQQELAELLYTTPQNISKYEKEGINNIDTIIKINDLLECNLLKDEIDVEGTIGEIGKEILCVLVEHNGFIEVNDLIVAYMHGLAAEQITKEIIKLENIGLCVREQYVGHLNDEHDGLFITAKGFISLKNNLNPGIASLLFSRAEGFEKNIFLQKNASVEKLETIFRKKPDEFQTYEQLVLEKGYETYQDLLDSMELQKLIYKLPIDIGYKANYILYLIGTYCDYEWMGKSLLLNIENCFYDDFISAEDFYNDLFHRMILQLDNSTLTNIMERWNNQGESDLTDYLDCICTDLILKYSPKYAEYRSLDKIKFQSLKHFSSVSDWYKDYAKEYLEQYNTNDEDFCEENLLALDPTSFSDEDKVLFERYMQYKKQNETELDIMEVSFNWHISKMAQKKEGVLITEWFTTEEYREFINQNFGIGKMEEEIEIDNILREINQKYPETLSYFEFPAEWEENGLAALVRKNFGIETN